MKYFQLVTLLLLIPFSGHASILSSSTTCLMANNKAEIVVSLHHSGDDYLMIMYNHISSDQEKIIDTEYDKEIVNVLGINYGVDVRRYITKIGTVVTLLELNDEIRGTIQGRVTRDEVIELRHCRESLEWDY